MREALDLLASYNHVALLAALGLLGVSMLLVFVRLLIGLTLYDRILAMNVFGAMTILLIALIGFVSGRPDFLDIALLYALINFVSTIAILKFLRYRRLGLAFPETKGKSDGVA